MFHGAILKKKTDAGLDRMSCDLAQCARPIAVARAGGRPIESDGNLLGDRHPMDGHRLGGRCIAKGEAGAVHRSNGNGANVSATLANENLSVRYSNSTVQAGNYKAASNFKAAAQSSGTEAYLAGDEASLSPPRRTYRRSGRSGKPAATACSICAAAMHGNRRDSMSASTMRSTSSIFCHSAALTSVKNRCLMACKYRAWGARFTPC